MGLVEGLITIVLAILIGAVILRRMVRASRWVTRTPRPRPTRETSGPGAGSPPRPHTPTQAAFSPETAQPAPPSTRLSGPAYIIDGDTIRIQKTQIRLFGIDAPELNHPHGKRAKYALLNICKGEIVHADILERDAHGRAVAKCSLGDGRDLSAEMVKAGLAIDWPKYSGGAYRAFETAEARKTLWLADARQKGRMDVWERFEARGPRKSDARSGP